MSNFDDTKTRNDNMSYIRKTMAAPLLSREDETKYAIAWRDDKDEEAMHKIIAAYSRLAVSIASKFKFYGLPMADLIQEGQIGMLKAAERFDPDRGFRFSTYAGWWIRAEIQDYVLRNWSIVRTGTTAAQKSLFFNLRRLRAKLMKEGETENMSDDDRQFISEELGVRIIDVNMMELRLAANDQSLNAPLSDDGETNITHLDRQVDERATPEQHAIGIFDAKTRSEWLKMALEELDEREEIIISRRRLSDEGSTLAKLGKELGISKERVRQLEARALRKIKSTLITKANNSAPNTSPLDLLDEVDGFIE